MRMSKGTVIKAQKNLEYWTLVGDTVGLELYVFDTNLNALYRSNINPDIIVEIGGELAECILSLVGRGGNSLWPKLNGEEDD